MDKTDALKVAQLYAKVIKENYNYNYIKVILFGSFAKGNFTENSDIDIAVVLNDYNNLMDVQLDLMRLRRKIDSRIEPHPFRERDFELSNPLVDEIIKYGQEIIVTEQ